MRLGTWSRVVPFVGIGLVSMVVVIGALTDRLLIVTGAVTLALSVFLGLLKPSIPMLAYIASIPFEDIWVIPGIGSVTRGLAMVFMFCYMVTRLKQTRIDVFPVVMWAYIGIATISLFWAMDQTVGLRFLWVLFQQLLMTLVVANMIVERPDRLDAVMWTYTTSAMITAAIALFRGLAVFGAERAQAFDGQSEAHFAAILIPALLFMIHKLTESRSAIRQCLMVGGASLLAFAVLVSGTRSAWLGVSLAVAVRLLPRANWRHIITVALVLGSVYVGLNQVDGVREFVLERSFSAIETGGAGRVDLWNVGISIFKQQPFLGVGAGNFPVAFTADAINSATGVVIITSGLFAGLGAHNIYLGTAVELGVVGFVVFLLLVWSIVREVSSTPESIMVRSVVIGYLVQGFFLDILNRKYLWFAIAVALGLRYVYLRRERVTQLGESQS